MKSVFFSVLLLGQLFASSAFAIGNCDFWEPNNDVKTFSVSEGERKTLSLSDRKHQVIVQYLATDELSISLFQMPYQDLVSVSRGTEGVTMSHMNPRFIVSCFWSE